MIRYVVVLKRLSGITREEFARRWREEHLPLIERLPGLVKVELLVELRDDASFDGVGVLHFESVESLDLALSSDVGPELRRHTATFARSEDAIRLVVSDA